MRMVQVLRSDTVQTYVYSPDSPYRPMARVDQQVVGVGEERVAGRQATVWHHHAHDNGQVHRVTDGNGDLVWQPRFSGLGEFRGAERHDYKLFDEPLRFAGQYADEETGLHYNLFRYYDPQVGRFVTQDPIGLGGGVNLYAYGLNPVSWIDPWGLSACSVNARAYEEKIQNIYGGKLPQSAREYSAIVNGKRVNGIADHVVNINGKNTAIEAKYVENWSDSIRNPESAIGGKSFAIAEQQKMLSQAQKYSAAFDDVIYHTNSLGLAAHYNSMFQNAGLNNVSFRVIPQ